MALETIERLTDDLDGTDAAETVTFGLDGVSYEIDLTEKNAAALRKVLDKYVRAARKGSSPRATGRAKATKRTSSRRNGRGYDLAELREWAGANKIAIPSRGRIPQAIVEQYKGSGRR